jgi:hypothetical protein
MDHTLIDGREVDGESHEWRLECLARYLLTLGLDKRTRMLAGLDDGTQQELLACMDALVAAKAALREAKRKGLRP